MRWNCPHCSAQLALADEKLNAQWSFARCYKCGGTSMLRTQTPIPVKVDRAPAGEILHLPEATEQPLLSKDAQANFNRIVHGPKPSIRTAERRSRKPQPAPAAELYLPEMAEPKRVPIGILPIAIGMTAALAVTSGIYLFLESQSFRPRMDLSSQISNDAPSEYPEVVKAPPLVPQSNIARMDRIQESAMEPLRTEKEDDFEGRKIAAATEGLEVQIVGEHANVHAGPGTEFPVVATALPHQGYKVLNWNGRWFKVSIEDKGRKFQGWLRNDLVQLNSVGNPN